MRMNRTAVLTGIGLVLGMAVFAAAQVTPKGPMKIKVTAEQANLREMPDIGSGIVQQIPEGTVLEADRKEGEWFFVRYTLEDGGVIGGWIHESLVDVVPGAALPPAAKPPVPSEEKVAPPRPRPPRPSGTEKLDFSTGSVPLEFSFSAGAAGLSPRDLNNGAQGFADARAAGVAAPPPRDIDPLRIALLGGFELTYRVSPRLAVGFGADLMSGASRDGLAMSGELLEETVAVRPAARAVPVKLVVRYYPGPGIYVRGALGVYSVKASYLYRAVGADFWQQWKGAAKDSGFGGEAAFGGELRAGAKSFLFVEAGFRIARFEGLAGESVYTDSTGADTTEAGSLYYLGGGAYPLLIVANMIIPVEGNRRAVVNLSGWAIRGGVRFRF
jgi:hypothetical protein